MAKVIMVQGTMSNAGKSLVAAGLCRIFFQDGFRVCPFKSQNMALNSYITQEGLEMGRAQVMQAEAAGIKPSVRMNPILLKPNSDTGSQVIVNGEVRGNMGARDYYARKKEFLPDILKSYRELEREYDLIVIEGAGSPAEINLKENDFVNMGLAKMVDAPVILVGDIDRGGVFAQLYGTVKLLEQEEQRRIKGMLINKFRGDVSILAPGLDVLEDLTGIPVMGVLPYMKVDIDEEDSLSERLRTTEEAKAIDLVVIRLPRLSNYTDFSVFEQLEHVSLRYVERTADLGTPDLIFLPGTKSTVSDLLWLRQNGLEAAIQKAAGRGTVIFGICGGYQMLGQDIYDPQEVEGSGSVRGIGLLPVRTVLEVQKRRTQVSGKFLTPEGALKRLSGANFYGYEIHHGRTEYLVGAKPLTRINQSVDGRNDSVPECRKSLSWEGASQDGACQGNVYGSYVHGLFDDTDAAQELVRGLLLKKGFHPEMIQLPDREDYKQRQYNILADSIRENIDMDLLYRIV